MNFREAYKDMFNLFKKWLKEDSAVAAVEAAMIFPMMLVLLVGVFDGGNAILANQKTVRASQVVADLIARSGVASDEDISEAIEAGRLAFAPLPVGSFGVDIVSVRFDDDANSEIVWRETENMSGIPDALSAVAALQEANEGVLMVTVEYRYTPLFVGFVFDTIDMREVAFSRGRNAPVIARGS